MASPRLNAFWRIAPGVRFIAFEIFTTGVLLFECALRSRTCSFVQATRLVRLAIKFILFERLSLSTSQGHDKHFNMTPDIRPSGDRRGAGAGSYLRRVDDRSSRPTPDNSILKSRCRRGPRAPRPAQICCPPQYSAHPMNHQLP